MTHSHHFSFATLLTSSVLLAACGPRADSATPADATPAKQAESETSEEDAEQQAKAREAAEKRAKLEALPALPGIEKPAPVEFPDPVITKLDNGLEVIVLPDHEVPVVRATVFVKAGGIYSPSDNPMLAQMTASLISEGTKKHAKAEIDKKIDATGGSLTAGSDDELARISANVLRKDLRVGLSLLAEETMQPAFPKEALTKVKDQQIQGVRSQKGQPQALAQVMAQRVVYGENSAYGRSFPTDEQIEGVTRDQITEFYKTHYVPNNAVLLFAGDIEPKRAKKLANKFFGRWKSGPEIPVPKTETVEPPEAPVVHIVDRMASAQAYIAVVTQAPAAGEDGWLETQVAKNVLAGGTLSTRLNFVLREQLGLTYGAAAAHSYGYDGGLFWAGGSTKTKTAQEFADALIPLVTELADKPLPQDDLRRVKNIVSGRFALEAEGVDVIAAKTMDQRLFELPADFWERYRTEVDAITPEKLLETTKTVLAPEQIQIVAVGRAKKIEDQLDHLGEVRVYNTDLDPIE